MRPIPNQKVLHGYPESEVKQVLLRFREDVATIRRELVDTGRMDRARGYYWRNLPDAQQ